jgi:hypothetical protein
LGNLRLDQPRLGNPLYGRLRGLGDVWPASVQPGDWGTAVNRDLFWWVFDLAVFGALLVVGIMTGMLAVDSAVGFVRGMLM